MSRFLFVRPTGQPLNANPVVLKLGDIRIGADSVEPVAGLAGVYEIKMKVPAGAPTGENIPLVCEIAQPEGGLVRSNMVVLAIEPVRP